MIIDPRNEVPLIHTSSRGNYPISELNFDTKWEILPTAIKLIETYTFKDTGELARKSVHVLGRASMSQVVMGHTSRN